ncbi:MAG: site-specific integrase [Thiocapsa sp.]|uniref:tyrosine-type recombinase/integrase n=1 Tax=Thiocapsa sp. TaxID=2024551 RepID=UPI001BCB020B|nr:site-specific integrase [Thiocapsa sp.]QVL48657.1 MAG: site-specific integrase [Thiocapsa sp.]
MLYRRNNSRHWWTRFTTPDGREVRRSTGTEDKKDAEEYEAKLKQDLWRVARLGEKPRRSWQEAVVQWIAETEHKASHEDDLVHLRWLDPHLKDKMLDEIDKALVDQLKVNRKTQKTKRHPKGVTNATVNRMQALLRAILRRAEREWEWLDKSPALRMLPEPKKRVRWLKRDEADRLIAELPEHLADMVRFSLATGLREANVTGLCWEQVDLDRRVAWVHDDEAKGNRGIGVPLNRDAVLVLRRWQNRHAERVFCYRRRRNGMETWNPVTKAGGAAWRKALERAGISNFRWHDLRHTWASWHVQAGTPLHVLQELGGWQSAEMVRRYAHLAPEHLSEHASRIETGLKPVRTFSGTPETNKATEVA